MSDLNYDEIAEIIRHDRSLPYTLTVEKIEDKIVWTHNQWGNSVKYTQKPDGHFDIVED